jgi:fatty acid desaturase
VDEQFETRPLIPVERLRALQQRDDVVSSIRLTLHLGTFAALIALVMAYAARPLIAFALAVLLAWVWSGLFAPFHECTHRTAFRSKRGNTLGAWLTGIPFMMGPAVYRTFHFEHHRHTQDPAKDPELQNDPRYLHWPTGWRNWLHAASGIGLIRLKLTPQWGFVRRSVREWPAVAAWADKITDPAEIARDSTIVLVAWALFVVACVFWIPGGMWLIFAAWLTHVFQTLWVSCEHTGLPTEGSILARTRTITSNAFVRFWLWNMNYHAEHHAWPGVPWHHLPDAHREIADKLESFVPGYIALHGNVIAGRNLPSCDPVRA